MFSAGLLTVTKATPAMQTVSCLSVILHYNPIHSLRFHCIIELNSHPVHTRFIMLLNKTSSTARVNPVRLCLSEHLSTRRGSKTNSVSEENLLMHQTFMCCPRITRRILIMLYSSAFPRKITHQLCLCVVFFYVFSAVDSAGRRTRAVVLGLAAVWRFCLTAELFQPRDVHLPARCCGGQREGFGDGRRYLNTQTQTKRLSHKLKQRESGSDHLRSEAASCETTKQHQDSQQTRHKPC